MATLTPNSPLMWAAPAGPTSEDTYNPAEAQQLIRSVHITTPVHGCVRRAVASALTTACVALGQDWSAEARTHFPQVFTELASESMPLAKAQ